MVVNTIMCLIYIYLLAVTHSCRVNATVILVEFLFVKAEIIFLMESRCYCCTNDL